ncbi:unnamed protein product [Coregonus sp. 'balchen']|nr:unnamed protein product [Coregonus sp. 'balchen']
MAGSSDMGREGKDKSQDRGASNAELLLHPELLSQEFIQLVLNEKKITTGDYGSRVQLTDLYLRHRPLIGFDGSSSKVGPVRLKKPEGQTSGSGVTDRFKPPPSMNLFKPIRKLSSTTPTPSSSSHSTGGPHRSPTGNKGPGSPPTSVNLKREADSSDELKDKKKIKKVTWP